VSSGELSHLAMVKRYLKDREEHEVVDRGLPFVTISRETGAGGHTLGRAILRRMDRYPDEDLLHGWEMFDQTLCALVAQDPELDASFESLVAEEYRSEIQQTIYELFRGQSQQYATYKRIFEVVRILAAIGKAIIVGRGGCCVTRGRLRGLHLRLVAPEPIRVKRMMDARQMDLEAARQMIRKQDHDRSRMMRDFFNRDIDDPLLYDAIINTAEIEIEELAGIVIQMIRDRARRMAL
jgi:cytidylate kinase